MSRALTDHDLASLSLLLEQWGFKPSHARRLLRAFYLTAGQVPWDELRVGHALRERIERELPLRQSSVVARSQASDGTVKLLMGFAAGGAVETVLMPAYDPARAAGCVSSQIGCAMGCDFCASTRRGLERNLTAGEIVEQFLQLKAESAAAGRRLSTLVFMGMGEPLHNLDNVIGAIRRIAGPGMGELGWKQITVSTVGIVPGIRALAEADLNVHLALSLHGPDDVTRAKVVPMNRRYDVGAIMDAARAFQARTGRIVNIEYCLLAGVNDSDDHAQKLAALMGGFRAHVNLIPYNAIGESLSGVVYLKPSGARVGAFAQTLRDAGVVTHIRRARGDDVDAACGQLRERLAAAAPI